MVKILLIAAGGSVGAALRYVIAGWIQRTSETFPTGTLVVNVTGCLLIGFLGTALPGPLLIREEFRIALIVGVLGGFTTFSSFGWECMAMTNDGQWPSALTYIALSNLLGLSAVWFGSRMATRVLGV